MDRLSKLQNATIFKGLAEAEIAQIVALGRSESINGGNVIFREGEAGNYLYIVLEGSIAIYCGDKCIAKCRAMEAFGEMGAFRRRHRTATARAITDVDLLLLDEAALATLLEGPLAVPFLLNVIDVLSQRLAAGNTWIASSMEAQRQRS